MGTQSQTGLASQTQSVATAADQVSTSSISDQDHICSSACESTTILQDMGL